MYNSLNEFIITAENRRYASPSERMGQAYFNALREVRPDLASQITGTEFDPFYNDSVMGAFMTVLAVFMS